ncbi:MAG: energy transducer TonB [Candidatus Omnitrophota bacterium]
MSNYWPFAFSISLLVHASLFWTDARLLLSNKLPQEEEKVKEVEVALEDKEMTAKRKEIREEWGKSVVGEHFSPPPYIDNVVKKLIEKNKKLAFDKPPLIEKNVKEINIIDQRQDENIKRNPSYGNYYNGIRGRLQKIGKRYYNLREQGEINLNIVVLRDGNLKSVDSYGNNQTLKDLALQIVKESAPFHPFPDTLQYPSIEFNICIEFKNN